MSNISSNGSGAWALTAGVLLCVGAGAVSGLFTRSAIAGWYATLAKPSFNPPNWIFGPVWTALYILMGVAAGMVWLRPGSPLRNSGLACFALQLVLNFLWSIVFFRWHRVGGALVEITILGLAIAATTLIFWQVRPLAGWLMVPYLAWVSFAGILNAAIFRLNR